MNERSEMDFVLFSILEEEGDEVEKAEVVLVSPQKKQRVEDEEETLKEERNIKPLSNFEMVLNSKKNQMILMRTSHSLKREQIKHNIPTVRLTLVSTLFYLILLLLIVQLKIIPQLTLNLN